MRKKFLAIVLILALALGLAGCGQSEPVSIGTVPEAKSTEVSIAICGDVMAHMPQVNAALQSDGTYNFDSCFDDVRSIMSGADICMANVECTFPGTGEYMGYPAFHSPDSIATALANAGVDVGIFANNHMNDSGLAGAKRTVEVLEEAGLKVVGCRLSTDQNRSLIYQLVKGGEVINVGVVAYTYETSRGDTGRTMNGGAMNSSATDYYNTFRQYADSSYLDRDIAAIKNEIAWCKERADITIVYLHWGEEYQRHSNKTQQYIAKALASAGADAIVASHPHVLQEISYVDGVPVYYSIGNYVSNQREETLDNHYTEQGLIAMLKFKLVSEPVDDGTYVIAPADGEVTVPGDGASSNDGSGAGWGVPISGFEVYGTQLEVDAEAEYNSKLFKLFSKRPQKAELNWESWSEWNIESEDVKAVPTWVNRYSSAGKTRYVIVPLVGDFENNESLKAAGYVNRAKSALNDIVELIGAEFIWTPAVSAK